MSPDTKTALHELHRPVRLNWPSYDICQECYDVYPCDTVRILKGERVR